MKRSVVLALVGAIACSAIFSAVPVRASSLYPVWIEMKGEGATITAFSPTFTHIRVTAYIPANTTKSYAMETAPVYEFRATICGKTHSARWTRAGGGVRAVVSCAGISFVQR
jgi:hypothetical protein